MKKFSSKTSSAGDIMTTTVPVSSIPYSDCFNQKEVRVKIVKGYRPSVSSFVTELNNHGNSKQPHRPQSPSPAAASPTSMTTNNEVNVGKVYVDPIYMDIMTRGWSPDPNQRPKIHYIVQALRKCYSNCLHRFIYETHFLVNYEKIHEENVKLSLLNTTNMIMSSSGTLSTSPLVNRGGVGGGGGGIGDHRMMASSFGAPHHRSDPFAMSFSTGSNLGGAVSYPRNAPSRDLIEAVNVMKAEMKWGKLEEDGAYLVVTPTQPYYMLWATKKWTQTLGYFVNDILGVDISLLFGPKTDTMKILGVLSLLISGQSQHLMSALYRRDGRQMNFSLNIFPVYDCASTPSDSNAPSLDSSRQSGRILLQSHLIHEKKEPQVDRSESPSRTISKIAAAGGGGNAEESIIKAQAVRKASHSVSAPPVGLFDLFSRSSSEFTSSKDIIIGSNPITSTSSGNGTTIGNKSVSDTLPSIRSPSKANLQSSLIGEGDIHEKARDSLTEKTLSPGRDRFSHQYPSTDEEESPYRASGFYDGVNAPPVPGDHFSIEESHLNRRVAYIVLHFSNLKE